jgi:hypothetical protein
VKRWLLLCIVFLLFSVHAFNQKRFGKIIQFSGYLLTADSLVGIPSAHLIITNRGIVAETDASGGFEFATYEGDTLHFAATDFIPVNYIVPSALEGNTYSILQPLTKSDDYLTPTFCFPWRQEGFVKHMEHGDPGPKTKEQIANENNLKRERAASGYKYSNQAAAPESIFNLSAWAQFLKSWENGDFKKKVGTGNSPTLRR